MMQYLKRLKQQSRTTTPVLKYFDPAEEITVQCDASQSGLGAALTQNGQPIAYSSRALTETEKNYAQIEKELLSIVFGIEKFHCYTYGRKVNVETDHKPLETIYRKPLQSTPKRLQRMLLRLQKYEINVVYKRGKQMYLADTLSRAYMDGTSASNGDISETIHLQTELEKELESIDMVQHTPIPVTEQRLQEIKQATAQDPDMQQLIDIIVQGWPEAKHEITSHRVRQYYNVREDLVVQDGVIFRGQRIVIPQFYQRRVLERIHSSYIGINGCIPRARECVYWLGMNSAVREYVEKCSICHSFERSQQKETLQNQDVPTRPWAKVGADLFTFQDREYLVTVDYHSNFFEVD